jgi:hypothetical protein
MVGNVHWQVKLMARWRQRTSPRKTWISIVHRGVVTAGATGYRREARGLDGLWLVREKLVDAA